MLRLSIPRTFVNACRSLHTNNYAGVRYNGERTEPFSTCTGVRQGCVLTPLIFNLFTAALTMLVGRKLTARGNGMRFRINGGLFNLRRLRTFTKTRTRYICDLQYADDCALFAHTPEQLQEILDIYAWAYEAQGLKINIGNTKSCPQEQLMKQTSNLTLNFLQWYNDLLILSMRRQI